MGQWRTSMSPSPRAQAWGAFLHAAASNTRRTCVDGKSDMLRLGMVGTATVISDRQGRSEFTLRSFSGLRRTPHISEELTSLLLCRFSECAGRPARSRGCKFVTVNE
jgi:hypothetical protein